jgi:hypothetical protein
MLLCGYIAQRSSSTLHRLQQLGALYLSGNALLFVVLRRLWEEHRGQLPVATRSCRSEVVELPVGKFGSPFEQHSEPCPWCVPDQHAVGLQACGMKCSQ